MTFGSIIKNAIRKAEFENEKYQSKVKVTGEGQRGQITIKNDSFQVVASMTQTVFGRF